MKKIAKIIYPFPLRLNSFHIPHCPICEADIYADEKAFCQKCKRDWREVYAVQVNFVCSQNRCSDYVTCYFALRKNMEKFYQQLEKKRIVTWHRTMNGKEEKIKIFTDKISHTKESTSSMGANRAIELLNQELGEK